MAAEQDPQGLDPAKETPGAELTQFSIQDAAGTWHWAKAAIDGDSVLVWHDDVKDPAHVRFGYQPNPAGTNLCNKEGLPATPRVRRPAASGTPSSESCPKKRRRTL